MLATDRNAGQNQMPLDKTTEPVGRVFEPPNGYVLTALARHKAMICVCGILFLALGVGYGLSRPARYTASATLQVGQVNPNSAGFFSYVQSAAALATAFSRAIYAEPVLATVQHKLNATPAEASGELSAEPIPSSPAFRVVATSKSALRAMELADVAARAVIAYEGESNSANPEAAALLSEYRAASVSLQRAVAKLAMLEHADSKHPVSGSALANALAPDKADTDAAQVRVHAIGAAYTAAIASQAPRSGLVSLIAGATSASSDRHAKVELVAFVALLVGIIVGCLAAIVLDRRRIPAERS